MTNLEQQGRAAKEAARVLAVASSAQKDAALEAIAQALEARQAELLAANARDLSAAKENGMRPALLVPPCWTV